MQSFPKQKKKKRTKKKEPERPSILHSRESGTCYLCMKLHNDYRRHPALQEHHIFGGCPNRTHSGHYGLKVYLCRAHHKDGLEAVHNNREMRELLCRMAQAEYEQTHTRAEWEARYKKNYL